MPKIKRGSYIIKDYENLTDLDKLTLRYSDSERKKYDHYLKMKAFEHGRKIARAERKTEYGRAYFKRSHYHSRYAKADTLSECRKLTEKRIAEDNQRYANTPIPTITRYRVMKLTQDGKGEIEDVAAAYYYKNGKWNKYADKYTQIDD